MVVMSSSSSDAVCTSLRLALSGHEAIGNRVLPAVSNLESELVATARTTLKGSSDASIATQQLRMQLSNGLSLIVRYMLAVLTVAHVESLPAELLADASFEILKAIAFRTKRLAAVLDS